MSRLRIQTVLWSMVAIAAIAYAPLALEYAWQDFAPSSPRLQNVVAAEVVSHEFAYGRDSVEASQGAAYHDARIALLLHTTFGGLAMLACLAQFSGRLRARHPVLHRRLGRLTLGSVAVSMISGAVLLAQAPPDPAYLGGIASTFQLIGLNLLTTGSAALALLAIRRRDVHTHRAWMIFMFAMLLSAPLLRLSWFVLGNLLPWINELMALRLGTVILVLLTPAGAIAASARSGRRPAPLGAPSAAVVRPAVFQVIVVAGVASSVLAMMRMDALHTGHDAAWIVIQFGPVAALWLWFGIAARRAHRAGQFTAAQDWQIYFLAISAAPIALNLGWSLAAPFAEPAEAYLISAMTSASAPLFAAYLIVTMRHATFWHPISRPVLGAGRRARRAGSMPSAQPGAVVVNQTVSRIVAGE